MATVYIDKLGNQEIVRERGLIREVVTRRDITDWWDSTYDGVPVGLGETAKRLFVDESFPEPGDRLVDSGGQDIMPNRPLYLVDMAYYLMDSNRGQMELRFEYLGSTLDQWTTVDGSLHQIQTHFDNQNPPQPITVSYSNSSGTPIVRGVEVPVQDPRAHAIKTYGRFLQPGETPASIVRKYLGKVNSSQYLEGAPGTWLVTNMTVTTVVERTDSAPALVQIRVEVEYNPRGYKVYAYWRDQFTNQIGVDLVEDLGYKLVVWFDEIDFESEFGP